MAVVAKSVSQQSSDQYELLEDQTIKAKDGSDVVIEKSLGFYTSAGLTAQKNNLQTQMDAVDAKLAAIAALQ